LRQTLFFIPDQIAGVPVFGAGWLLLLWAISSVVLLAISHRRHGWGGETLGYLPLLAALGAAIYYVLPMLAEEGLGLPIRGYGTMLLLGVVAGVGLAAYRAARVGLDPERIYSLAFWMFVAGIAGARVFFVVQYWPQFERGTLHETIFEILKFTEGGLVVYGSLIGAMIAFAVFCYRQRLSMLAVGDVIGPCMLVGLAIGRMGCLLNGCCFGGVCESGPFAITFPEFTSPRQQIMSPPFSDQLLHGQLHGVRIEADQNGRVLVRHVQPGSAAERSGLRAGTEIEGLNGHPIRSLADVREVLVERPMNLALTTTRGDLYTWSVASFPTRSLPVHPTQIYSAINAFLLAWLLWQLYAYRTRDGQIIALTIGLYALTRFLLEAIRNDEPGRFGTSLTISQIVSLVAVVLVAGLIVYIQRQSPIRTPG